METIRTNVALTAEEGQVIADFLNTFAKRIIEDERKKAIEIIQPLYKWSRCGGYPKKCDRCERENPVGGCHERTIRDRAAEYMNEAMANVT